MREVHDVAYGNESSLLSDYWLLIAGCASAVV